MLEGLKYQFFVRRLKSQNNRNVFCKNFSAIPDAFSIDQKMLWILDRKNNELELVNIEDVNDIERKSRKIILPSEIRIKTDPSGSQELRK